jgi:UDP-N-acetylmuramoyl-L-alanyl-D-glutamate--2,6-diaminopimelate ligase
MAGTIEDSTRGLNLQSLLEGARFIHATDIPVSTCRTAPEACEPGDLPEEAAAKAVARGASAIITERLLPFSVPQCLVADTRWAWMKLAEEMAGRPGTKLFTIGVVGANGKSSAVATTGCVLRQQGIRTAYFCDLGASDGVTQGAPAPRNASAEQLIEWLADASDANASVALIEITPEMLQGSHADPAHLDMLLITDGIDLASVRRAVRLVPEDAPLVVNADCPRLRRWLENCDHPVLRYGFHGDADVIGSVFRRELGEMTLLVTAGNTTKAMRTKLTGRLLAQSQLAATAIGLMVGGSLEDCSAALEKLSRIPGRNHRLPSLSGPAVFLDAAGNAVRLRCTLKAIRGEIDGKLTAVVMLPVGAAPEERAMLARMAEKYAQKVIFTSFPGHRRSFLAKVHDALDGVQHPERLHWIAGIDQAISHAIRYSKDQDGVIVYCPQENRDFLTHRELLERLAGLVAEQQDLPQVFPHPNLSAAV